MKCVSWLADLRASGLTNSTIHAESRDRRLAKTLYPQNWGEMPLTQLVNVQRFKPASTSKIALLPALNGHQAAAVFGRTLIQQALSFEAGRKTSAPVRWKCSLPPRLTRR